MNIPRSVHRTNEIATLHSKLLGNRAVRRPLPQDRDAPSPNKTEDASPARLVCLVETTRQTRSGAAQIAAAAGTTAILRSNQSKSKSKAQQRRNGTEAKPSRGWPAGRPAEQAPKQGIDGWMHRRVHTLR